MLHPSPSPPFPPQVKLPPQGGGQLDLRGKGGEGDGLGLLHRTMYDYCCTELCRIIVAQNYVGLGHRTMPQLGTGPCISCWHCTCQYMVQHPANAWPVHHHQSLLGPSPATTWPAPGQCLASTWPVPGQYLASTWPVPGQYLASTWPVLASTWPVHGQCLAR